MRANVVKPSEILMRLLHHVGCSCRPRCAASEEQDAVITIHIPVIINVYECETQAMSQNFVQGRAVLQATFEDELVEDAKQKRHSLTCEAVEIGSKVSK